MRKAPNTIYIGYDPKEQVAYDVLKYTIERTAIEHISIKPIKKSVEEHKKQ